MLGQQNDKYAEMLGQRNDKYAEMLGQQNDKYTEIHGQQNDKYNEMHSQQNDKYTEMHGMQNFKKKVPFLSYLNVNFLGLCQLSGWRGKDWTLSFSYINRYFIVQELEWLFVGYYCTVWLCLIVLCTQ